MNDSISHSITHVDLESKIELSYETINAILCLGLYQERMLRYLQKKDLGYKLNVENLYEGYQRLKPILESVSSIHENLSKDLNNEMQFIEKIYSKYKQDPDFRFDNFWITNHLVYPNCHL